jgi:hypothetical protein
VTQELLGRPNIIDALEQVVAKERRNRSGSPVQTIPPTNHQPTYVDLLVRTGRYLRAFGEPNGRERVLLRAGSRDVFPSGRSPTGYSRTTSRSGLVAMGEAVRVSELVDRLGRGPLSKELVGSVKLASEKTATPRCESPSPKTKFRWGT